MCKERNHFAPVCQSKVRFFQVESGQLEVMSLMLSEDVDYVAEDVNIVSPQPASAAVYTTLCIRNRRVHFQIDTRASCNVIQTEDLACFGDEMTLCKTG